MGAEEFRVRIHFQRDEAETVALLVEVPGVREEPRRHHYDERTFVYEDAAHIAELTLMTGDRDASILTARFALCHDPSIDTVFTDLVNRLASALNGTTLIEGDVPDPTFVYEHAAGDGQARATALAHTIPIERALWQADFGRETAKLRPHEATRRFILSLVDR